jgi:predicted ATP-grasp superfamily ATP-dependent carboligase
MSAANAKSSLPKAAGKGGASSASDSGPAARSDFPSAVILGGSFATLGAASNLAKHGIEVCVLAPAESVARFSRSVQRFVVSPSGLLDEELPDYLIQIAKQHRLQGSVLFPVDDEQVRVVALNKSKLTEHYILTTPDWDTVRVLYDKRLTYELARQAGVPIPCSHVPGSAEQLARIAMEFPLILKPACSARLLSVTNRKAYRADNREELHKHYEKMSRIIGPSEVIVQELLPEPWRNLFSFAGYFRNGEPVVGLSARRTRQLPHDFGRSSTFVQSVDVPELNKWSGQLLRTIRYTGLAEVEFMWNPKRDRFELLEVNPRLWAWHSLLIGAGIDLPFFAFAEALGQRPAIGLLRPGAKWVRLLTDVRAAAQGMAAGSLGLRQYMASLRGTTAFAVFSLSDPLPGMVEPFLLLFGRLRAWQLKYMLFSKSRPGQRNSGWRRVSL